MHRQAAFVIAGAQQQAVASDKSRQKFTVILRTGGKIGGVRQPRANSAAE
jgi:hypothetical protein